MKWKLRELQNNIKSQKKFSSTINSSWSWSRSKSRMSSEKRRKISAVPDIINELFKGSKTSWAAPTAKYSVFRSELEIELERRRERSKERINERVKTYET